jgi:hypothetical protein
MSRKDWDELKRTDETSMECGVTSPLGDTLDLRDVDEGGDFEDFEMEVVDENGKPVGDCYIGELDIDDGIENVSFDDEDDDES